MSEWKKEEATNELRFVGGRLQQKWLITCGGLGRVEYSEEWRDVPAVEVEQ
jgi:hypothetical protein